MENASKALIIAGSVLLSILIIAMGVLIFNKAKSSADTTSLDQTEINMFNSKFERYDGTQLGSQVKSLMSFAISNASTNGEDPIKLPSFYLNLTSTGSVILFKASTKYFKASPYYDITVPHSGPTNPPSDQTNPPSDQTNPHSEQTTPTSGCIAYGGNDASTDQGLAAYRKALQNIRKSVVSTATYKVELGYGDSGLINEITITKQ